MKKLLSSLCLCLGILVGANVYADSGAGGPHHLFDQVLRDHVVDGQVDYDAIRDDLRFSEYVQWLTDFDVSQLPDQQAELAFWINAYNALAIQGILDGGSPSTLVGRYKYFKSAEHRVAGLTTDLYDLEHDIILPLGEPRIHFAIVCASYSCPMLRSEAYVPERLEQQLDDAAVNFINDARRNSFEPRTIYISKIFEWFRWDFKKHSGSVQKYLAQYVEDPQLANKLEAEAFRVGHLAYDWRLNGTLTN